MKRICLIVSVIAVLAGCTNSRKVKEQPKESSSSKKDTLTEHNTEAYHPSSTKIIDVIHTKLEVNFDWEKQYLNGKAAITLKPYFYPVREITLDAKNFDVKGVYHLLPQSGYVLSPPSSLPFTYNKTQLTIKLDKEYSRNDTLKIYIDYVAKPNERETNAGSAITSDKGLYFINPLGKEKNKPTQLWTQGEPESSSCWFPTVDKPNERMTQEIYITVDAQHKNFITLSNGLLISSIKNPDGSRTDYWKQSLPSAPYLVMMAVGDFAVVKDTPIAIGGKNIEVSYYIEAEYEPYAKAIFGNTPEMLEFFSNKLGTPYPWEKFSQVVVRDYVSGAMENTSAVLHGSFLNQTDRDLLDKNYEDIIAHELFHQWFGDYVTCEQWSNLTLNEGFATYGEYLWQEYKYGRDAADQIGYESMHEYLSSAEKSPKHLIRYRYNNPDDIFDAHSYNKGGAILHMLRKYIGDDAFFTSLKQYLEKNKFSSVEADNLRLIVEQVTGEDLHWFFDQWFFAKGHPKLLIQHAYVDSSKRYSVSIQQTQDPGKFPLFKIPLDIDIYSDGKRERKRVWINNRTEVFSFDVPKHPDFVNVDADKSLLCIKEEKRTASEYAFQYKNCPLYTDRMEALKGCSAFLSIPEAAGIVISSLNDKNASLRERAISLSDKLGVEYKQTVKEKLIELAINDVKASVRSRAIETLDDNFQNDDLTPLYLKAVNDKSYEVAGTALSALRKKDKKAALQIAKQFESEKNMDILLTVADIYSLSGGDENNPFFVNLSEKMNGWNNVTFANTYTDFLKRCSDDTINIGVKILEKIARMENNRLVRHFGQKGIKDLADMYSVREQKISSQIANLKEQKDSSGELKNLSQQLTQAQNQKQKLTSLYNSLTTTN